MCRKLMKAMQDLHAKNKAFGLPQNKTEIVEGFHFLTFFVAFLFIWLSTFLAFHLK